MKRDDIVKVLLRMGVQRTQIRTYAGSPEVTLHCPLAQWRHNKKVDRRPSMSIRANEKGPSPLQCFSCKFQAASVQKLVEAVQDHDHTKNLLELLLWVVEAEDEDLEVALGSMPSYDGEPEQEVLPSHFDESYLDKFARAAHPTMLARGMSIDSMKRWGLLLDKDRRRVIFPMRDKDQRLLGVSGRAVDSYRQPKYLNYSWVRLGDAWQLRGGLPANEEPTAVVRFPKSTHLFGEHLLGAKPIAVVIEGQMDAILTDQVLQLHGIGSKLQPVAFQGNALTRDQADLLVDSVDEVILFMDNDQPGMEALAKAKRLLAGRIRVSEAVYPQGMTEETVGEAVDPALLAVHSPLVLLESLLLPRLLS